jgi:Tol biopolymer transport system component
MNYSKKIILTVLCTTLLVLAGALSACGGLGDALGGAGGLGSEDEVTPTEESVEILPPEVAEPPTATPIPTPFGNIVFLSNREGQMSLYLTTADGSDPIRLTSGAEDSSPVLSPDRTRIAYASTVNDNTDIYILDLNTRGITRVTTATERDSSPSWSPSGQQIVFDSFRNGNLEIYIVDVDGSNENRLTNDPAGDSNPVWSPTNNEIAFVSNRFGNSDILIITPNGQFNTLTSNVAADSAPAWSPDGNFVAFKTLVTGTLSNLCVIARDGMNQTCITTTPAEFGTPVWSPDGRWIAIHMRQGEGAYNIVAFNIVDGNILQVSAPGINARGAPSWSPDGVHLVFQAQAASEGMDLFIATLPNMQFTRLTTLGTYDGEPLWFTQ